MDSYTVLGKRTVMSVKTGKPSTTLFLSCPYSEYELENSIVCEGLSVISEWTTLDTTEVHAGDTVQLLYSKTSTGKARLAAIRVVKQAAK